MTKRYPLPKGEQFQVSERLFDVLMHLNDLAQATVEQPARSRIAFSRLYAYATERTGGQDPELERLLKDDPVLRADFRRLLEKTAAGYLPQVAAASSGAIELREGRGYRIRFEPSRAEPDQTFVIIELTDPDTPPPDLIFLCDAEYRCAKFPLPSARDGVIQILLEQDSELLDRLLDISTEVFFR